MDTNICTKVWFPTIDKLQMNFKNKKNEFLLMNHKILINVNDYRL